MSIEAIVWAMDARKTGPLPAGDRLVLIRYANHAGDDGKDSFPSVKKMAPKVGMTERNVRKCVSRLVQSGHLVLGDQRAAARFSEFHRPVVYDLPIWSPAMRWIDPDEDVPPVQSDTPCPDGHPLSGGTDTPCPDGQVPPVVLDRNPLSGGTPKPSYEPSIQPSLQPSAPPAPSEPVLEGVVIDMPATPAAGSKAKKPGPGDYTPEFEAFWSRYPRKVGKKPAFKAWSSALKAGTAPAVIIDGLDRHLPYLTSKREQFRPHPSTWLNEERWNDEVQSTGDSTGWLEAAAEAQAMIDQRRRAL